MEYKDFLVTTLQQALDVANNNFGKVSGTTKAGDNNQVLTETDLEIGKLIIAAIQKNYPQYNIIDEEAGIIDSKSEFTWVVDPIDGTSNFANGLPTFGIIVGLLKNDVPVAGGIALPFFKEIVIAEKGCGAFANGEKITVSQETNLLNSLIAYGIDGHQENPQITEDETSLLSDIILSIRNLRSSNSTFDTVMTAKGKYGASLNRTSKIWDNVGQQIVVEEAGGVYTDFFGAPVDYTNALTKVDTNFTWCAASPALHKQLQEIIHRK